MKKLSFAIAALYLVFSLAGCAAQTTGNGAAGTTQASTAPVPTQAPAAELSAAEMFSNRDKNTAWEESKAVSVTLADGASAASTSAAVMNGNTITLTEEGTYILSGALTNGQVIVAAPKDAKLQIVLNGVQISRSGSAPFYVKQADKVFVTLAGGTQNSLLNTGDFTAIDENNIDAAVFSKEDITFNGTGELQISSETGHGIVSKDDLIITGGNYKITAQKHGLSGKDSIKIAGGTFQVVSGKDGLHAENTENAALGYIYIENGSFTVTAETDGLSASAALQIEGGRFTLTTGGGSKNASTTANGSTNGQWGGRGGGRPGGQENGTETETSSAKGLKSGQNLIVKVGTFVIDSSDDALHTNASLYLYGGTYAISSGDDGLHADAQLIVKGGTLNIAKSYEGLEGKSIDIGGGAITLTASDDGLNAAGGNDDSGLGGRPGMGSFAAEGDVYIRISGGELSINAAGDGIDSNGSLYVSGGNITIQGPESSGNGTLDYDGQAEITGGSLIGVGSSGMAQNFSSALQGSILYTSGTLLPAGTAVTLQDSAGNTLLSLTARKQFNSVIVSSPSLKQGESYTLLLGTEKAIISLSSLIYGGGQGGAGRPGVRP